MQIVCAMTIAALADGAGHTLPVAERSDHAGLPVMMPRESDGKLRRGGSETVQPVRPDSMKRPVDERGRLHGAPELDPFAEQRIVEKRRGEFSNANGKRRCNKASPTATRLRRQDKSRILLGRRMDQKAKDNSPRTKGAREAIKVLNGITRFEFSELDNLPENPLGLKQRSSIMAGRNPQGVNRLIGCAPFAVTLTTFDRC